MQYNRDGSQSTQGVDAEVASLIMQPHEGSHSSGRAQANELNEANDGIDMMQFNIDPDTLA